MRFLFLSLLERKTMWVSISVSWEDLHCHKGSHMQPSCKYLSVVFPAALPMLTDLHSDWRRLFWQRMWICVSVCEHLVIWCNKTTVHEIIAHRFFNIIYMCRLPTVNLLCPILSFFQLFLWNCITDSVHPSYSDFLSSFFLVVSIQDRSDYLLHIVERN
jgi:hypothetical protein